MYYLGIDPGSNGGLATLDSSGKIYALQSMPSLLPEVLRYFQLFQGLQAYALLEQISGYVGVEHPGSRMFEFGRGYGALEMALTATELEYDYITPQKWQRGLGLRTKAKSETDNQWKNYLKAEAQKRFPRIRVKLSTADALLIAYYNFQTKDKTK